MAADLARLAGAAELFWPAFEAPGLALDFDASDFVDAVDLDGMPRAGEREAVFVVALFEVAADLVGPVLAATPDFAAVLEAALDFDAPPAALVDIPDFVAPDFDALAPDLVAAFVLLGLALFAAPAVFFVPLDAPPEPAPALRDFVVLSAMTRLLVGVRVMRSRLRNQTFALHTCSAALTAAPAQ